METDDKQQKPIGNKSNKPTDRYDKEIRGNIVSNSQKE